MRISDWSSDVCSSDLPPGRPQRFDQPAQPDPDRRRGARADAVHLLHGTGPAPHPDPISQARHPARDAGRTQPSAAQAQHRQRDPADLSVVAADRKSVVTGKSVSVRVDPGGRRIIKKKTVKNTRNETLIKT